jgi:hypothetical protein
MENDRKISPPSMPDDSRALFMSGLWVQVGFVGACVLAIALTRLLDGGASAALALTAALGAGMLTAFAWRRSLRVLDRVDVPDAAATAPARLVALGQGLGSAVSR